MSKAKKSGINPLKKSASFLRQVQTELALVIWPSRSTTIKLTAVVVGASIFIAVYIGLLDMMFTRLLDIILG